MNLEIINPLDYQGWDDELLESGDFSFFHTAAWANVLVKSYGYRPVYFYVRSREKLSFLMPIMAISSLLTGKRGVSLPYSDFCDPFYLEEILLKDGLEEIISHGRKARWDHLEMRFSKTNTPASNLHSFYLTHDLNLKAPESDLFLCLEGSNRRNVKKAIRKGLHVEFSQTPDALGEFYRLNCQTRKRHGLPPQPVVFFRNVIKYVISQGFGMIASAVLSGKVIAAAVFFHFGDKALFKYGASNAAYLSYRPNNLLLWEAIKRYRDAGFSSLNLGRTNVDNFGLLRFKRSWRCIESPLKYIRYDYAKTAYIPSPVRWERSNRLISAAPIWVSRLIGRLLYKHMG
jgi:hypothetical protein